MALYAGDLDGELSRRAEVWIETLPLGRSRPRHHQPDDPSGRKVPLQRIRKDQQAAEADDASSSGSRSGERFWDAPLLWWGEISGPLLDLATGRPVADYAGRQPERHAAHRCCATSSPAPPRSTPSPGAPCSLVAFLLFDVYAAAALMAVFMIVGLSRAVNRLSRATEAVRRGDFGVRIPVRRRDQVGDLQRSFNEMAGNLETLVATAAQKESLEKELELARNLQKSLLPSDLPAGGGVEFATLFEPSAAIGGDYFDVLRLVGATSWR